jgi:hypothetical protein
VKDFSFFIMTLGELQKRRGREAEGNSPCASVLRERGGTSSIHISSAFRINEKKKERKKESTLEGFMCTTARRV